MHFGKEFDRYEQQSDGTVRAYFTDGTSATGDVLVAADGVGSRIRDQFLPHAEVVDTGIRWLGGKTVLTDELRSLLPTQITETFSAVPAGAQSLLFGLLSFRQDPNQVAEQLWPGLRFHETVDYIFWGLLTQRSQLALSDEELKAMSGPDLKGLVLKLGVGWPQGLHMLIERCRPEKTFVLRLRYAKQIEHWQTTNITLLGQAFCPLLDMHVVYSNIHSYRYCSKSRW